MYINIERSAAEFKNMLNAIVSGFFHAKIYWSRYSDSFQNRTFFFALLKLFVTKLSTSK